MVSSQLFSVSLCATGKERVNGDLKQHVAFNEQSGEWKISKSIQSAATWGQLIMHLPMKPYTAAVIHDRCVSMSGFGDCIG